MRSVAGFDTRLLDHFTAAVVVTDPDGLVVGWNRAAERTFGWSEEQAIGQSIVDLLVTPDHASLAAEIIDRLKSGQPWEGELDLRHKEGRSLRLYSVESPILDDGGEVAGMIALSLTIPAASSELQERQARLLEGERTAREAAEAAEHRLLFLLRATTSLGSSLDYRTTLDNLARLGAEALADVCIVDLEEDGQMRRMAAVSRDPAKQALVDRIRTYSPDIAGEHPAARVMRTGRPEHATHITEYMFRLATPRPDPEVAEAGRELHVHSYICAPLAIGDRTIGTVLLLITDPDRAIEEADVRLAADLARRAALAVDNARLHHETARAMTIKEESLALLDTLLATAPVGLGFVDRDLRYLRINDSLAAMTAATPEAHIGRTVREMLPELAETIEPLHHRVLETGEPVLDVEITGTIPGGRGIRGNWLSSFYPVRASSGAILGVGVVVVDITERKRTEDELRAARQELTDQLADLTRLLQLSGRLSASLELQPVLDEVLATIVQVQNADMGVLRLYDSERDELYAAAVVGLPDEYIGRLGRVPARAGVWGKAFAERRPFVTEDVNIDPDFADFRDAARTAGYRAAYTSPLITRRGDIIGTIATHFRRPTKLDVRGQRLIELYAYEAADVIDNARLYREARDAQERLEFLAEASRILSASLDYRRTLQQLARLVVPRLADWCAIDVKDEDGSIRQVAVAHVDPEKVRWAKELQQKYPPDPNAPTGSPNVIRTGRSEMFPEIPPELIDEAVGDDEELRRIVDEIGFQSLMVVPLTARGRTIGALTFVSAESGRRYGATDLAFAEDLARRAAQAVDNARLFTQQRHIARTLQESLLPPALPRIPGVEVAARYRAAGAGTEVGGDFYDLFETSEGEWGIVMGDVCGKGPEAAAVTGLARYTIRAAAMRDRSPSAILTVLNEAIRQQREDLRFATVAYMRMAKRDGAAEVEVACGGHPLPIVVRRDGTVETVGRPGTLLGIFEDAELADDGSRLKPGDAVILYTDGLSQERSGAGPLTEKDLVRMIGSAAGSDADELADRLLASAVEPGPEQSRDDVAVLVIRVQP